jgi:hypothetical protein
MLALALGFHILIVPSQLEERKVSFETRFQCTEKTSRACSCHDCTGNWERVMSKSLTEPSPPAVRIWFSLASDHVLSKSESCVSNLECCYQHVKVPIQLYESSPLLRHYPVRGQTEDIQPSIAYKSEVCRRGDGDARIEEGRVLDAVAVVALRAELEHREYRCGLQLAKGNLRRV